VYTLETVSWYELITTHGRWLRNVEAEFRRGEFKVSWVRLDPGEDIAVLIDRLENLAYLNKPLEECQILAAQHDYELVMPRKQGESFVEHIEKFLGLLNAAALSKGAPLRAGHNGHGSVDDAGTAPNRAADALPRAR
jgi:hypothetical protein